MAVSTQGLTSLSRVIATTPSELEERTDASLVRTSSAEPLNAIVGRITPNLSSIGIGEGKLDSYSETAIGQVVSRVPVVSELGIPLMPCKPAKARKLLKDGKAVKKWSKLGIFYIQLKFDPKQPVVQPLAIGIDLGSKFEGVSIVGTKDTVLNIMSEAVDWFKDALKQRKQMRRARRYRNARRRPCRGDNRLRNQRSNIPPPSAKARWDAKLRIVSQLKKILPIRTAVIEDVKAETKKGEKRWNGNFSPLEVGKRYFYSGLQELGLKVIIKQGYETEELRKHYGLEKIDVKPEPIFESHCVDAWALASSVTNAQYPTTRGLYYLMPLRFHRRQLHRLGAKKGSIRRRYGGTISLGLKKGTLVKHIKYGLCYIGDNLKNRFSLHSLKTGKRITQKAKREDFSVLTRIAFRTQFLPP